jgi:hypothetical protein
MGDGGAGTQMTQFVVEVLIGHWALGIGHF